MANVMSENKLTYVSLGISFVNVFMLYCLIATFKRKIDYVVRTSQADENEEEEVFISKYTMQVQNIPRRKMKIFSAERHLNDVFKEVFGERLVKVNAVPELRTLDYFLLKKKEYSQKLRHYLKKNASTH